MSGVSSSRRLQLKADFTDLFRASNTGTGPSSAIQPGEQHVRDTSPGKKRSTRIPFVGRSSRKSIHSDVAQLPANEAEARPSRSSAVTSERSKNLLDEKYEGVQPRSSVSQSSLHASSLSGIAVQPSIGTKIAAHLTPSKSFGLHLPSRKSIRRKRVEDKPSGDNSDSVSDTLSPPSPLPRSSPNDSTSTLGSRQDIQDYQSLSGISRPSLSTSLYESQLPQPTITVSRPPIDPQDDLDEFKDLFTKPQPKVRHKPAPITVISERSSSQMSPSWNSDSSYPDREVGTLTSPALSTASVSQTLSPTFGTISADTSSSIDRSTPTPRATRAVSPGTSESRNHTTMTGDSDHASLASGQSLFPRQRSVFAAQQRLHRDGRAWSEAELDSAEESEAVSTKSVRSMPSSSRANTGVVSAGLALNEKRRTLAALPHRSRSVERSRRSLLTLQNASSEPPSIPLPSPPSPRSPPQLPLPDIPSDSRTDGPRPRAQTMAPGTRLPSFSKPAMSGSLLKRHHTLSKALEVSSPLVADSYDSHGISPSPSLILDEILPKPEPISTDVDSASPDQLRDIVRRQTKRYEEVTGYVLKITEAYAAERAAFERKIAHLEREATRRDKEIKGLTWLVMNGRGPPGTGSRVSHIAEKEEERNDDSSARSVITTSASIKFPFHRHLYAEDSGGEYYSTSTTEWRSGKSDTDELGGEGVSYAPKARRGIKKLRLVESVNKTLPAARSLSIKESSSQGPGIEASVLGHDVPSLLKSSKRLSMSLSGAVVSSASSTSSTSPSPTSVTFPTVLSAIPESRPTSASSTKTVKDKGRTISLSSSASEREEYERHSPKHSHYSESPSPPTKTSSRLTPSEAYVRNLKLGRPPSIAQVLDQTASATIEESYGGRSRALLGLTSST